MVESRNILVVDDNEVICNLLNEFLTEQGYAVTTALCGEDTLTRLGTHSYHLVMLDLVLPDMVGTEILRKIRQAHPATDVIMMTSNASLESALDALRLGAQDYLLKPFENLEMILLAVNKIFERQLLVEENASLYQELLTKSNHLEQTVKRLTLVNRIANAFHSVLNLKDILQLLIQSIAQELGAERASLMLIDKVREELSIEASVGIDELLAKNVKVRIGEGIAGWVAMHGEVVFSEDIHNDQRFQQNTDRPYHSDSFISAPLVLSVPIKMQHVVIGVININNKTGGGSFTAEDTQLVTTLAGQAAVAIENARNFEQLRQSKQELQDAHYQTIGLLSDTIEAKDSVTGGHSERMLCFASAVAQRLGLDEQEIELLRYAALLHDIGKIGISEQILQKPSRLTPEEYAHIKQHPRIGADMIREVKFLTKVAPIIHAHHEWFDGSGYPHNLAGDEIPIQARIVAALDAFDAMTSERPYRSSLGRDWAIQELRSFAGRQFDPQVVDALLIVLENERDIEHNDGDVDRA